MGQKSAEDRSSSRLLAIEIGRGFAAIFVVLFHFNVISFSYFGSYPSVGVPFYGGHAGVEYFFVLSGFIIYYIHASDIGKSTRLTDFLRKRIIRIIPMYWLTISLMLVAFSLHPIWGEEKALDAWKIVRDYLLIPRHWPLILPPAWTLEREALFYVIFGICILGRTPGVALFLVWQSLTLFFSFFSYCYDTHLSDPLWYLFGVHNLGFFVGVCCSWAYTNRERPSNLARGLLLAAGATLVLVVMFIEAHQSLDSAASQSAAREVAGSMCYTIGFGLIIYSCVWYRVSYTNGLLSFLSLLGGSSYIIYLMHEPIASLCFKILASHAVRGYVDANLAYALTVVAAIAASVVVHLLVERPVGRYLRKKFISSPIRAAKVGSAAAVSPLSAGRMAPE